MSGQNEERGAGSGLKLIAYWALVGIPLLWGVLQTLSNALKLFR